MLLLKSFSNTKEKFRVCVSNPRGQVWSVLQVEAGDQAVAPPTSRARSCKCVVAFLAVAIILAAAAAATPAWYFLGTEFFCPPLEFY